MTKRDNRRWRSKVAKARIAEIANKKMTLKEAQKWAQSKGLVLKKSEDGEYVMNYKGGKEATAYYTNDLADAVGTGEIMCKERDKHKGGV